MLACLLSHLERIQRWAAKLGLHSLQRRQVWADLIIAFKVLKGLLDVGRNLFSLPPTRGDLKGHPSKVLQGTSLMRISRRTADLEQLRIFPLAPQTTNDINSTLLAWLNALFHALFSGINAATFPVLIWLFTRLPPGSRRIRVIDGGRGRGHPFRWGSSNIGISFPLPSFWLPLWTFSRKGWNKFKQRHIPTSSYNTTFDWTLVS